MNQLMKECLVTVIIPVYNVEDFLDDCVNSVVSQSYSNLEIILVDDQSPDNCPAKCDEWSKKDNRIIVLHKEVNQGLGEARNTGIDIATGKYILFLDSDDYIEKDAIKILVETAEKEEADIVGSGEFGVQPDGTKVINFIPRTYKVYRGEEIVKEFLPNIIAPDPVSKEKVGFSLCMSGPLFASKILKRNGWRCASERQIISEDTYSFIDLCSGVNCAVELPVFTMNYRINPGSLSHSVRLDRKDKNIDFYNKTVGLAREKGYGPVIESRLVSPYLSFVIADLKQISCSEYDNKKEIIVQYLRDKKMINILSKGDYRGESIQRRVFVFCVKNHLTWCAAKLIMIKVGW